METINLQENKKIYFSSDNHLGLPGKVNSSKREKIFIKWLDTIKNCLLYTSPSPRDRYGSRMPSSA